MAKVDPVRRAEIGREKRARTRAQLVAAASALYARQSANTVTVDDIVNEAGLAKGTFYGHFLSIDSLTSEIADQLLQSFDELLQPVRLSLDDPGMRIAFGCSSFITKALDDTQWATLVARMLSSAPRGAETARQRLLEDMNRLAKDLKGSQASADLSTMIVFGIMLQVLHSIGEDRFTVYDREPTIRAILRAIGLGNGRIDNIIEHSPPAMEAMAAG